MKRKHLLTSLLVILFCGCSDDSIEVTPGSSDEEAICGDGIVQKGEKCDDGNKKSGDGCSSTCKKVESGYTCPKDGGVCTYEAPSDGECGNTIVDDGEKCDDGNTRDGDGCSADCQSIEAGYECPKAGGPCTSGTSPEPVSKCGNGKLEDGEKCDDGNERSGDGCTADCTSIEDGYSCHEAGYACVPKNCGNGVMNNNESCDDGIDNVDYGEGLCGLNCQPAHYCGDGLFEQVDKDNGEECDDGHDTSDQYGGCTWDCMRSTYCSDGIIQTEFEQCDDGNETDGDGCSSTCRVEPNHACKTVEGKSQCIYVPCGNGQLDEMEACDDGNRLSGDGCSASCTLENGFICTTNAAGQSECTSSVGNGIIDAAAREECDDGNTVSGDGCSNTGHEEAGWICPTANAPCIAKACGDGILAGNEECDDGNTKDGDGCSYRCRVEKGWGCDETGKNCAAGRCGDGIVQKGEACDNDVVASGLPAAGDGCSATCKIEAGFECNPVTGECHAVVCGDGKIAATDGFVTYETCDLGTDENGRNLNDGTAGCAADCTVMPGYHCDENGRNCATGTCGDGYLDKGEACDDGNHLPADGCSPDCKLEPGIECTGGKCGPICGDGVTMWMLDKSIAEECDDGNLVNGDGCSSDCKIETGYTCTEFTYDNPPAFISLPVTYRDFRSTGRDSYTPGAEGFITAEHIAKYPETHWGSNRINTTIRDFDSQSGCPNTGYTLPELDEDGKPVLAADGFGSCFSSRAEYGMWYRNIPGLNREVRHRLYMWLTDSAQKKYYFTSDAPTTQGAPNTCVDGQALETGYFLPLASTGYGYTAGFADRHANYSFTSEVSTYFQYKGGESLTFSGDDDLWVYLNGHLFVDLGGLHGPQIGVGTLEAHQYTDESGNPVLKGDGTPLLYDPRYKVYEGGVYEMKLFHAERNATGSNFSLTLTNFLNSGTASCEAVCGDGIIRGNEECDYPGIDQDVELQHETGCSATCRLAPYCGNGKIEQGESCDTNDAWCIGCRLSPDTCGNDVLDPHEECDGTAGISEGQICLDTCRISGCGDGIVDPKNNEQCDDGNQSDEDMCTHLCTLPTCGDGIVSEFLGEVCDDTFNDGAYGHCGLGCTYHAPFCGDGTVNSGEECDNGKDANTGGYGACKPDCTLDIRCGDGIVQEEFEQCDGGADCNMNCELNIN